MRVHEPATHVVLLGHAVAPRPGTREMMVTLKVGPVGRHAGIWRPDMGERARRCRIPYPAGALRAPAPCLRASVRWLGSKRTRPGKTRLRTSQSGRHRLPRGLAFWVTPCPHPISRIPAIASVRSATDPHRRASSSPALTGSLVLASPAPTTRSGPRAANPCCRPTSTVASSMQRRLASSRPATWLATRTLSSMAFRSRGGLRFACPACHPPRCELPAGDWAAAARDSSGYGAG